MPVFVGAGTSSFMKASDGVGVSTMTTTQRNALSGVKEGQIIFNTTINLAEYYDGSAWKPIDSPPTISSVSPTSWASNGSSVVTFTVSGSNFQSGATIKFVGNDGTEYTSVNGNRVSSSSFTLQNMTSMGVANEPYDIVISNPSGLNGTLDDGVDAGSSPTFATAANTIVKTAYIGASAPFSETTLAATDPDGSTVTHTISSGSLPTGLSLNSAGVITGTIGGSAQTYTFTVSASDGFNVTTRSFRFTTEPNPYVSATGGTVLTSGDYKTHVFTSNGNFVVLNAGLPGGSNSVEYLVVAGGGSGASGDVGGGGGAGGVRENYPAPATGGLPVSASTYPITIGGGGSGVPNGQRGNNGSNSVFSSITSAGGGGGGVNQAPPQNGKPGGCGGGAGWNPPSSGGSGNTPPVSPPQGQPGGNNPGGTQAPGYIPGGGGGGSQAGRPGGYAGGYNSGDERGKGGNGKQMEPAFFGPTAPSYGNNAGPVGRYFGGGGGASSDNDSDAGGPGGSGGGGYGGRGPGGLAPSAGSANTGGGSGGGAAQVTGNGGSGFVAIRYKYQ